jgi:2-dehydropantoate 2-reductase
VHLSNDSIDSKQTLLQNTTMNNSSNTKPKVLLIGFGSVGTMVSYTLEHLGRAEVCAVARENTYEAIANQGYRIESLNYGTIESYIPSNVTLTSKEAKEKYGPFDFIVITTKNIPDIAPVVDMLEDCYDEKSVVVLIQNGIGIEIPIFRKYPKAMVMSGVTLINTTLYDSTVKHVAKDVIKFGPYINYNLDKQLQLDKCQQFVNIYSNDNNDARLELDVKFTRWRKLVYNTCINTSCALTNLDSGRMEMFGGTESIIIPAMREVIAVAKSEGVNLPESVIDDMLAVGEGVYYPPSMLIDVRNGEYVEHINIIGNVVKYGTRNGVSIPTLIVMNNLLKLIQMRTMEAKSRFVLPEKRPLPKDNFKIKYLY